MCFWLVFLCVVATEILKWRLTWRHLLEKSSAFLEVVTWFSWRNSRNNGCNCLICRSSTDTKYISPRMDQSCPQKSFLPAVTLSYKSFSSLYSILPWIVHNHLKLVVCLLTWHQERYMLYTTTFLPYVSTYEPRWCPFNLIGPTSYSIRIFHHWFPFISGSLVSASYLYGAYLLAFN